MKSSRESKRSFGRVTRDGDSVPSAQGGADAIMICWWFKLQRKGRTLRNMMFTHDFKLQVRAALAFTCFDIISA